MRRKILKYRNLILLCSFAVFILFIFLVPPDSIFLMLMFYVLAGVFLINVLSLKIAWPINMFITLSVIILLILRQIRQFNLVNFLIVLSLNLLLFFYFQKSKLRLKTIRKLTRLNCLIC